VGVAIELNVMIVYHTILVRVALRNIVRNVIMARSTMLNPLETAIHVFAMIAKSKKQRQLGWTVVIVLMNYSH